MSEGGSGDGDGGGGLGGDGEEGGEGGGEGEGGGKGEGGGAEGDGGGGEEGDGGEGDGDGGGGGDGDGGEGAIISGLGGGGDGNGGCGGSGRGVKPPLSGPHLQIASLLPPKVKSHDCTVALKLHSSPISSSQPSTQARPWMSQKPRHEPPLAFTLTRAAHSPHVLPSYPVHWSGFFTPQAIGGGDGGEGGSMTGEPSPKQNFQPGL